MDRRLSPASYHRLKDATRRQIKASGGLESAAAATRVGKTELGTYQTVNQISRFAPIDVIADLQADSGDTAVLEALAALLDCIVLPLRIEGGTLHRDMAAFGQHAAEVFRDYATMRNHGTTTAQDVERLDRDLELVIHVAVQARATLRNDQPPDASGRTARRHAGRLSRT